MEEVPVTASIHFLKSNPVFSEEKPYAFRYEIEEGPVPQSNMTMEETHGIKVCDIRNDIRNFTLERNGFEVMQIRCELSREDFLNEGKLATYFQELETTLKKRLRARKAMVFRHGIRKRHPGFPISTGEKYDYDQPTSVAHIDTTPEEMLKEVERQTGLTQKNGNVEWINVWKPLRGPLNDWPLALCDEATVTPKSDLEPADILYPDLATENFQVYHNKRHRWYYLSDHMPDEIIVFRQASTFPGGPQGEWCLEQSIALHFLTRFHRCTALLVL